MVVDLTSLVEAELVAPAEPSLPTSSTSSTTSSPSCTSVTLPSSSWVKLSSTLLSHPAHGRCHLRIAFSTFSDGLLLRKFDWNEESVS